MTNDPTIAVYFDRRTLIMKLADGSSIHFNTADSASILVLKECLREVTKSELRSLAARHPAAVAGKSLTAAPKGWDDDEVGAWKRIARVQERFRSCSEGWSWWTRFSTVNSGGVCEEILEMLTAIADAYPGLRRNGWPVDWMSVLRQAMADTSSTNVAAIRTAIGEGLSEPDD